MTETEPTELTEDIGGVQGSDPKEDKAAAPAEASSDQSTDVAAPDAGEIEWAGAVVGKAPRGG